MRHEMRHIIETDAATFWQITLDPSFTRAVASFLGGACEVLEEKLDDSGVLHRRIEHRPKLELPAVAKKMFGDGVFTELAEYHRESGNYVSTLTPNVGAEKFIVRSALRVEPISERSCERVLSVENTVRLLAIGKTIESFLAQPQRDAQDRVVQFANDWIRERGL